MNNTSLISGIFYLLGIGLLVPWNAFISAQPYLLSRICNQAVELWLGLVYNISTVLSLGCWLLYNWFRESRSTEKVEGSLSSTYAMVMGPLFVYMAIFFVTSILVLVPTIPHNIFFIIAIFSLTTCGSMNAFASAGMVATASALGTIGPLFAGQALGGVAVSTANFVAAMTEDSADYWDSFCGTAGISVDPQLKEFTSCPTYSIDWAVFSYFGLSFLLITACLIGFKYINSKRSEIYDIIPDISDDEISRSSPRAIVDYLEDEQLGENSKPEQITSIVWEKIKDPAFSLFLNFVVTLTIFPGWTSSLQSVDHCRSHNRFNNDLFTPLTFLWFNTFDLIGRLLAEKYYAHFLSVETKLLPWSVSRCIFLLLFMLLPSNHLSVRLTPISSDIFSFLVQAIFALSNGFMNSWCFLSAPAQLETEQEQVKSSSILNFCVSFGLLVGSCLEFFYLKIATS